MAQDRSLPVKEIAEHYLRACEELLQQVDIAALERVVQRLRDARDQGATIYVAGNGGSAATASHWVNDLGKATKRSGQAPMRVMSLSDNVSWLTNLGTRDDAADHAQPDPEALGHGPVAESLGSLLAQDFMDLPHGQSLCRHRAPFVCGAAGRLDHPASPAQPSAPEFGGRLVC